MAKLKRRRPTPTKPSTPPGRTAVTNVRSTPEWKEWVHALADFGTYPSVADLFHRAVVEHAKAIGFHKPAPKR